jgi:dolichol-phosphate mannosyltransferase
MIAHVRSASVIAAPRAGDANPWWGRNGLFALVFTLVPLAFFAVPSLWSETKLHWTGPIWLAALPAIAASFALPRAAAQRRRIDRFLARSFGPLVHGLLLGYAVVLFYYPVYGFGGHRNHHHYLQMGWRDLRQQVQAIEDEVLRETGRRPAIAGLDKHNTTDEMAFYDPRGDGAVDTVSRHLFFPQANTLMYARWFPREAFAGRDLIVVARRRSDLEEAAIAAHATRLGPVRALTARKAGDPVGQYFARVVYGYQPGGKP